MRLDTSITDIEFEDAMMARRRRPRPARHTCATCAHDGCCEGLPHCGGRYWSPVEEEEADDEITDDGLCEECAERRAEEGE